MFLLAVTACSDDVEQAPARTSASATKAGTPRVSIQGARRSPRRAGLPLRKRPAVHPRDDDGGAAEEPLGASRAAAESRATPLPAHPVVRRFPSGAAAQRAAHSCSGARAPVRAATPAVRPPTSAVLPRPGLPAGPPPPPDHRTAPPQPRRAGDQCTAGPGPDCSYPATDDIECVTFGKWGNASPRYRWTVSCSPSGRGHRWRPDLVRRGGAGRRHTAAARPEPTASGGTAARDDSRRHRRLTGRQVLLGERVPAQARGNGTKARPASSPAPTRSRCGRTVGAQRRRTQSRRRGRRRRDRHPRRTGARTAGAPPAPAQPAGPPPAPAPNRRPSRSPAGSRSSRSG